MKMMRILFLLLLTSSSLPAQETTELLPFFKQTDAFLKAHVNEQGQVDYAALQQSPAQLNDLVQQIEQAKIQNLKPDTQKAFYINAYNLLVIKGVVDHYPIRSPMEVTAFFEDKRYLVAGKKYSLKSLEAKELLAAFKDPRLHFVLNCAAVSCPQLLNRAYFAETLDQQLDQQTTKALDNSTFLQVDDFAETVRYSQIFDWYIGDFDNNIKGFIQQYRSDSLPPNYRLEPYTYNWELNAQNLIASGDDDKKFVPIIAAATLPKGSFEFKSFSQLFTASYFNADFGAPLRQSYFSSFNQFSYGLNGRLDIGFDLVYQSILLNDFRDRSIFRVFSLPKGEELHVKDGEMGMLDSTQVTKKAGLSHFAPRIRLSPFKKLPGFSIQQAFYLPAQREVDGGYIWVTDFFYNHNFTPKQQIFVALTFWQNIYPNQQFRFRAPFLKVFYSWLPTNRLTFYATTTWLAEWGLGGKFLITPNFELELLATRYLPVPFVERLYGIGASTLNIGLRFRI